MKQFGKTIMVQGTGSNVGKTTIAAALCRIFAEDGYQVAPFKAWNMSLNSGVTPDGGEIGRGQIVQAEAAGITPTVDMNPILLKPQPNGQSQIIVRGKVVTSKQAQRLSSIDAQRRLVRQSLDAIRSQYDITVIEGSGSPAEPNRMHHDIANMSTATYAGTPVMMVGNIDSGGVFASLRGTLQILKEEDPEGFQLVKGLIINNIRSDPAALFAQANTYFKSKTGIPVVGVIPHIDDLSLADEDATGLLQRQKRKKQAMIDIAVPYVEGMQSLQNTDDFKSLDMESFVQVRCIQKGSEFGQPDLVLLCGSKGTVADLQLLKRVGIAKKIQQYAAEGGAVIGICGGYQMLGQEIRDPYCVESNEQVVTGLKLLPAVTTLLRRKVVRQARALVQSNTGLLSGARGMMIAGYEIHTGRTQISGSPALHIKGGSEGVRSTADGVCAKEGWVVGTYLHGFLNNALLRKAVLENIAKRKGVILPQVNNIQKRDNYQDLARIIRSNVNTDFLYQFLNREL